ncbi:MAG: hypothetical protein ABII74_03260, partial [Elusimicrobiota bacterium]
MFTLFICSLFSEHYILNEHYSQALFLHPRTAIDFIPWAKTALELKKMSDERFRIARRDSAQPNSPDFPTPQAK